MSFEARNVANESALKLFLKKNCEPLIEKIERKCSVKRPGLQDRIWSDARYTKSIYALLSRSIV